LRDLPATVLTDEEGVNILSGWRYREQRPLSVHEFFLALARLGGHQNRKCDGEPGWLVAVAWLDHPAADGGRCAGVALPQTRASARRAVRQHDARKPSRKWPVIRT